jgi:hypothetical protein
MSVEAMVRPMSMEAMVKPMPMEAMPMEAVTEMNRERDPACLSQRCRGK